MLAALLLLGLLPLAAMPMLQTSGGAQDDGAGNLADEEDVGQPTMDFLAASADASPGDAGETFLVGAAPGETVFDAFVPGADLVQVDLSGLRGDLVFEEAGDAVGSAVSFAVGENAALTLRFPGLEAVPAEDIDLVLAGLDGETFEMTFSEVVAAVEAEASDPAIADDAGLDETTIALDPVDPELPDPPPPDSEPEPGIDPVDPGLPDDPIEGGGDCDGLDPVGPDEVILGPEGDLALRALIERDSDAEDGLWAALDAAFEQGTDDTLLTPGDDALTLADDGLAGTGAGGVEMVEGTPVVTGDGPVAVIDGGVGDDSITGGDAAGYVFGGEGDDVLIAGEGAAALFGGAGADALDGGASEGGYLDGGAGDDTLTGGAGNDTLEGGEHRADGAGDDSIDGGAGDDLIRGGRGADTLAGGDGDDVIDHLGRAEEREIAEHHEFAWHLDGAADFLSGGAGDDRLIMDGADVAEGGAGADLFWVHVGGGAAEILDFNVGEDFLRLSLDPHLLPAGSPEVTVEASEDGADALVSVNGGLVAILRGAAGATASDVYAEVAADVFPAGP